MMTRRQLLVGFGVIVSGSNVLQARQQKKGEPELQTVTLIIDGMT